MNDKMVKLDSLMGLLENKSKNTDSIKEIFTESIKEQVSEVASDVVSDAIDKVDKK